MFFVQVLSTTHVAAFNTGLPLTFNTVAVLCDRKHMQNNEYRWLQDGMVHDIWSDKTLGQLYV